MSRHPPPYCSCIIIVTMQTSLEPDTSPEYPTSAPLPAPSCGAEVLSNKLLPTPSPEVSVVESRKKRDYVFAKAISRVLNPVMITMALAVWFVQGIGSSSNCNTPPRRVIREIELLPGASSGSSSSTVYSATAAGIFIGAFVFLLISFTFILLWLYKTGRTKIIMGWIFIATFVIFAYLGGLYIFDFYRSRCIDMDWITLVATVWNFTITGLFAIFSMAPRLVNHAYLILMSALMAYVFRTLPSWSVWAILSLLVLWDLYAVLAPGGPLKKLVAIARERGDPLPALVYDTNPHDTGREDPTFEPRQNSSRKNREAPSSSDTTGRNRKTAPSGSKEVRSGSKTKRKGGDSEKVGTLGNYLKLGLGDFVFYSILVSQASKFGAMTTITCFVAILAGLCATLILVYVCQKPLPALPISITVALLFYVLTRFSVYPFVLNLFPELIFH